MMSHKERGLSVHHLPIPLNREDGSEHNKLHLGFLPLALSLLHENNDKKTARRQQLPMKLNDS